MTIQQQYEILQKALNEQQWRVFLGTEALKIGYGGISQVAALSGADWKTVQRGVKELPGDLPTAAGKKLEPLSSSFLPSFQPSEENEYI